MSIRIYYDPLASVCKSTTGAIAQGKNVTFNLYLIEDQSSFQEQAYCKQAIRLEDCRRPEENLKGYLQLQKDGECMQTFPLLITE